MIHVIRLAFGVPIAAGVTAAFDLTAWQAFLTGVLVMLLVTAATPDA